MPKEAELHREGQHCSTDLRSQSKVLVIRVGQMDW